MGRMVLMAWILRPTKESDINNTEEKDDRNHSSAATPVKPKTTRALQAAQQAKLHLQAARRRRKRLGQLRAAKLEALKKRHKKAKNSMLTYRPPVQQQQQRSAEMAGTSLGYANCQLSKPCPSIVPFKNA